MLNTLIYLFIFFRILAHIKADFTVSDSMPACKGFTISNSAAENKFGYAVDGSGDFDGDGIPDFVISGYNQPSLTTVYLIYGQSNGYTNMDVNTMSSSRGIRISGFGVGNFDNPGFLSLAGDLDGDGKADLVVGAAAHDGGAGAVYVIYGGAGYTHFDIASPPSTVVKISGPGGWVVNTKLDINGDGKKDLVSTSSGTDGGFGAVFVIFGSSTRLTPFDISTLTMPIGFKISGFSGAFIGAAFGGAGDFNGDDIDDFTFSAPGALSDAGEAYVVYGKKSPSSWFSFSLDSSTTAMRFTVTGSSAVAYKLCLVASDAGDFNNDGYSDVIWGSPPTNSNQGHVVIIYGANGGPGNFGISSLTSGGGLKLLGASTGDYLGSSLSSLKDLSGDGITEILVGSKGASSTGVVYVIYGTEDEPSSINLASLTDDKGFKIIGSTSGSLFGQSVKDIGDINGDGVPDIAIGAPGAAFTGKVYVVFGVNAWACNTCSDFKTCQTCQAGYDYKWNGVCYKDCPVHAPYKLNWECFSSDPIPAPDPVRGDITLSDTVPACKGFTITNSAAGNKKFAYAVNGGGDFNGDEVPDIVISTYDYPSTSTVYVVYGKSTGYTNIDVSTMTQTNGFKISGLQIMNDDNSNFITLAGDLDDDDKADLVIGASQADSGNGAVYVIYGGTGYTSFVITSPPSTVAKISNAGGWNVNTRTDFNGDGVSDLIFSSKTADSNRGAVYVIYGSSTRLSSFNLVSTPLTSPAGFKISGEPGNYLGTAIASAGKWNGDQYDDIAISAPDSSGAPGKVYVIYGDDAFAFPNSVVVSSIGSANRIILTGASPMFPLSSVASEAGDFNGNGDADTLWGAPKVNTNQGSVLLVYGRQGDFGVSGMTASQGIKLEGVSLRDLLGSSLSGLPDMDGDGISEILVGAPGYSYNKGVMYLLFGREDEPPTIDLGAFTAADGFKILGSTADGLLGSSVRDVGDINGDGAADFIIGAPGTGSTGKAHIVFGVNAWACDTCGTFKTCQTCKTGYDYKWNGVCYKDCPPQAPYKLNYDCLSYDPTPPPDPARGDITLSDTVPVCKGFTITNSAAGNKQFAYAVHGGGDFNGDEIPDIVISTYDYPSSSTVYVIYGRGNGYNNIDVNSMTTTQGFKITGLLIQNDDGSNFISLAGDLDGDDKADLVIGASKDGGSSGATYVIYGGTGYSNFVITSLPSTAAKISGVGGWSVDTSADINGDELADLIISLKAYAVDPGAIFVIYGSQTRLSGTIAASSITSPQGFKLTGSGIGTYLGAAVTGVGDFNGDDIDDFTFTAPGSQIGYVIYGTNSPVTNIGVSSIAAADVFKLNGVNPMKIANVASGAGDFNDDGFSDVLFAVPAVNTNQGSVVLVYGANGDPADFSTSTMTASKGIKLTGVWMRDFLGSSLSSLPDMNGDGISEILVGAKGYSFNKGIMYLLFGRDDDPSTIDLDTFTASDGFKILSPTVDGLFGTSVRDLGDINGDGVVDFIIGAPGTGSTGKAHVVFGVNAWGCDTCDTFKTCQACKAGYDFTWNGVCYQDCPAHAPYKLNWECFSEDPLPPPDPARGDITLSDTVPECKGFTIFNSETSPTANKKFAYVVDGGGDFNGDEIPDIVVSTYNDAGTSTVYVIYGKSNGYTNIDVNTMTSTQGFKITNLLLKCDDNSNFITLAGDLDDDGKADLVIGASQADSNMGAVYVIYGGPGYNNFDISSPPSTAIKISGAGGWNVNTRADINGDKISDLIISSKAADSNKGIIAVIYGSPTRLSSFSLASLIPPTGFKIVGLHAGDYLGAALTNAGDFNGDEIDDFAFSAPGVSANQGRVYVLYGKEDPFSSFGWGSLPTNEGFTVDGENPMDMFRLAFVGSDGGDFNDDGVGDVLWGTPKINTDQGSVLLVYGADGGQTNFGVTGMTASQGIKLTGVSLRDLLGSSLSSLKDMDGDGISEILVGAPGYSYNKGVMYLLFGRDDEPATIDLEAFTAADGFKILGNTANGLFGTSVRNIGDINGDGVADFIIGAPGSGTTGRAHVVFGVNAWACDTCDTFKTCQACKPGYDYTWNGVCYKDCPAHAPYKLNWECFEEDQTPPPDPVRGDITLSDPLPSCKGFVISNSAAGNKQFAYSVNGGGDFNGDKIPDIVISTYEDPNPSTVYVIYGKSTGYTNIDVNTMASTQGFKITGLLIKGEDNSNFISMSGDIDKDGKADLVIGASQADSGAGAVYVIYGKQGYNDFAISSLPSTAAKIGSAGGWNVNTRADINGDKAADIIIGSKGADSNNGVVYVIYGSPTRLSSFDIISTPLISAKGFKISGFANAYIGTAVANAGDFNGDKIDDFTFTAPGALTDQGVLYVIYGKDTPPFSDFSVSTSSAAGRFTVTGASSIDKLCLVTSNAGDFNGDGASDILCASPITNTDQGAVLLIYGGGSADFDISSMAANQGIKLTGVSLRDFLGSSLSSLSDINGDGIADILVAAKGYSYNKGAVYLLFGRDDEPSTIDLDTFTAADGFKMLGSTPDGLLGSSMRDIGDINGDGISDIIIGAPGIASDGKAYVLFGPNAWACDTCDTSTATCQVCKPGYDYTWNGLCYKECPVHAPYRLNWECFAEDPTPPPDSTRGDITLSDSLDSCQGFAISNSAAGNTQFAYAVSGGGDFNGDKIPDIVISTYENPSPSTIYVIYGKSTGYTNIDVATMTAQQGFKITGLEIKNGDNSNFITLDGDLDQDGKADLVIGASLADSGTGAVYVIYGIAGQTGFAISTLPTNGIKISNAGGWNVNTKIDLNGDKISDLIIAAKEADSNNGAIYVIYGSQTRLSSFNIISTPLTPTKGFKISGFPTAYLGGALASAGDFNKDNIDDFTFSAPGALSGQGVGYVLYGKQTPPFTDFSVSTSSVAGRLTVAGASSIDQLFLVASSAGDFNQDGFSDILWASPSTNTDRGAVFLIYGGGSTDFGISSISASQGIKLTGVSLRDLLGSSLASLPDVNGDGINEILIGAKGYSYNKGVIYLLYGREDKPSTINLETFTAADGFKILGSTPGGLLGASVKSIGDLNGDGVSDILIGAPGTSNTGRAYVLFGPNAWGCDTCSTSKKCKACKPGYDYTYNEFCYKKCPINTPFELNNECFTTDPNPPSVIQPTIKSSVATSAATTYAANKVMNFWSPADALPFLYGQLKTSITYLRFLNVSRSDKLEEMLVLYADSDTNIIPWIGLPDSIKDSFPQQNLPYMFTKYEVPSSFMANFGDDFACFALILVIFTAAQIALTMIKKWMRNIPTVKHLLQKLSVFLQNFFVGAFAEALGPIVFYATMEFKNSTKGGKVYSILSPLTCYLCILLGISIMFINIWVVRKFQIAKRKTAPEDPENIAYKVLEKKYEGCSVLYGEFDNDSLGQQAAFLFFNIRSITESFIVGVFYENPIAQVSSILLLNLSFLLYIFIKKPFDSKLALVQQFSLLLIIFTCNCCFLHLARADHEAPDNFNSIIHNTSEVVFYLLLAFQFVPLVFFTISLVKSLITLYHFLRTHLSNKKKALQKTSKLHHTSSISPFDHSAYNSSILKTGTFDVAISEDRLLTADPLHPTARIQHHEYSVKPPSAGKSLRIHSRKKRMITQNSEIETFDLGNQPKEQISQKEIFHKPYSLGLRSRKKRIQSEISRLKDEKNESSNFDINLENPLYPLPMITDVEIEPVQIEPPQDSLAYRMFKAESRKKRTLNEISRLQDHQGPQIEKSESSNFDINMENSSYPQPLMTQEEIKSESPYDMSAYQMFKESRRKRIQSEISRLKANNESSNFDLNLEKSFSPVPIITQDEIKPVQEGLPQEAEGIFELEPREKRIQNELSRLRNNSNSRIEKDKGDLSSFQVNFDNPIVEEEEIKYPEMDPENPEKVNLGQVIQKLKPKKRRKNSTGIIHS